MALRGAGPHIPSQLPRPGAMGAVANVAHTQQRAYGLAQRGAMVPGPCSSPGWLALSEPAIADAAPARMWRRRRRRR